MKKSLRILFAILLTMVQLVILAFLTFMWPSADVATSVIPGWHTTVFPPDFISAIGPYLFGAVILGIVLFILNTLFLKWIVARRQANSTKG